MKEINCFSEYDKVIAALDGTGAFLTVKNRAAEVNTMTIGCGVPWGLCGISQSLWLRLDRADILLS